LKVDDPVCEVFAMTDTTSPAPSTGFQTSDSAQAYAHFAPLVASTPDDQLAPWHAHDDLIRTNLARGVSAVQPTDPTLVELPTLALAMTFAAGRAGSVDKTELHSRQARLRPARDLSLRQAEIFADMGLVDAGKVRDIRAGSGGLDEAKDGIALAALLQAPALAGKHPFTPAFLAQLAEDGNWLLPMVTPRGAAPAKAERTADERVRDQLWTELLRRYDLLYAAGVVKWGKRAVDAHVPSLLQRAAPVHAAPAAKADPVAPTK
jgi:hypothetical protein